MAQGAVCSKCVRGLSLGITVGPNAMISLLPSCLLFRAYLRRAFSFICASSVLRMLSLAS